MRFLIIDDDDFKITRLKDELKEDDIDVANSFISGLRKLHENEYDGIFLDMNFPHYDNERAESDKGIEILERLIHKKIDIPVCIYSSKYIDTSKYKNVFGYIYYSGMYDISNEIKVFRDKVKN